MTKKNFYILQATACFLAYLYVGLVLLKNYYLPKTNLPGCFFKQLTSYPCPSCGTTRSVKILLLEGDIGSAFVMNPMGILVASVMVAVPFWLVYDGITKKQTLYDACLKIKKIIATRRMGVFLIVVVTLNWIWNINKQL